MKNLIPLILLIIMLSGCSVKTADDYYSSKSSKGSEKITISINCKNAVNYNKSKYKTSNILKTYTVYVKKNSTVFDVLKTACKEKKIQFEYNGSGTSTYIKGINYLYEFDCGELSGWEYSVNNKFPDVSCGTYKVKDGDSVKWLYTCDLGKDIGNSYMEK